jgi:cold shock CspA family protein
MGRSQETMGKKEKEKKKAKKKQDKEERKEERKANNSKGKGLDEMLAYIDENGNITDSPPDPKKKIEINAEDIKIGPGKREEEEPEEVQRTGKVTFFNESKGYGFIKDMKSQESIFVHVNGLEEAIRENDKVMFEIEAGMKGPIAVKVKKAV